MSHVQNSHGTVDCPVELVRAHADQEVGRLTCSACGAEVQPRAIDWPTELTFTDEGQAWPFVEDENGNITGYGQQDPAEFAAAVNRWEVHCGAKLEDEDGWTAKDVTHHYVAPIPDRPADDWSLVTVPEGTPGGFHVTALWGQR